MSNVKQLATVETNAVHRQELLNWITEHEQGKSLLVDFLAKQPLSPFDLLDLRWRQKAMARAVQDLEDDAASKLSCETGQACKVSEATGRLVRCNDLSWAK